MTTAKKPKPVKKSAGKTTANGRRIVAGLRDLVVTMKAGGMDAVRKKFTTYTPSFIVDTPSVTIAEVAEVRQTVGAEPETFAAFLGVDVDTLRGWEGGKGSLPDIAARFLAEIRRDPTYWRQRLTVLPARTPAPPPA
jgi:DNA-binding transcriptional regulator YiaG